MYYARIRSLLRERPDLRPCLKRCRDCGIRFFTDRRNAGRADLRCGFGCREAHRRRTSTRRTVAYYREHPEKKRRQNQRRYLHAAQESRRRAEAVQEASVAPIVRHVRLIVSLIERRRVGLKEVLAMLAKKARQHRMAKRGRRPYGGRRIDGRGS